MRTVEETRALGEVHPEFEPILKSGNPMLAAWTMDTNIFEIRDLIAQMRKAQPEVDPATLSYTTEDIQIPLRDGFQVAARTYKPRSVPADGCSGFIVFHGGGYLVGDLETEGWLCTMFTSLGGIAVNIDYRHAPEHVFPQAINDTFDATKWGLLVGGESSGAEISLIVSHLCREDKMSPPLTGVFASIPGGVNEETVPDKYKDYFFSKQQNANAPILSAESVKFLHTLYQSDQASPLAFPIAFPDHTGVPKTYFQVCGFDPLRDCGLVFEQVYKDAGVPTKLDVYPGMPHAFWAILPHLELARKHTEDTTEGLRWLLAQ